MSNLRAEIETGKQHTHDLHPGRFPDVEHDIAWVQKRQLELVKVYGEGWIAVKNKKVICSGKTYAGVAMEAAAKVADPVVLWIDAGLDDLPLFSVEGPDGNDNS